MGLQRFFHTFPSGFAGAGLLMLRLALAASLVADGAHLVAGARELGSGADGPALVAFLLLLCAALTGAGFLSDLVPFAVIGAQAVTIGLRFWAIGLLITHADVLQTLMLELAMALGLAMIGPGAYSVDARLSGRQEIVIPPVLGRPLH
jgi:uncharacterized membrane protein YphA (DoxX/SURF4 family)